MTALTEPKTRRALQWLHPEPRRMLQLWIEEAEEDASFRRTSHDRKQELVQERKKAEIYVAELQEAKRNGRLYRERRYSDEKTGVPTRELVLDDARLNAAIAEVQSLADQLERIDVRARQRRLNPTEHLVDYVHNCIKENLECRLYEGPPPALPPDEQPMASVLRIRSEIEELQDRAAEAANAPLPSAEVKKRLRAFMKAKAMPPDLRYLFRRGAKFRWPEEHLPVEAHFRMPNAQDWGHATGEARAPDVIGILALLLGEKIVQKLEAEIDLLADDEFALSDDALKARLAEYSAEMLRLERAEETALRACEGEFVRRSGADPRAVLMLSDTLPRFDPKARPVPPVLRQR